MHVLRTKILLLCITALTCFFSAGAPIRETGAWSKPVNGVQGRLIVSDDPPVNDTKMVAVYLELRNVSDFANPIWIYYDPSHVFQCQLLDATGKPVERALSIADIWQPPPFWLALPHDSSLRFRISVSGYGIPHNAGTSIQMDCGNWLIKTDDQSEYALEVTFASTKPQKDAPERRAWEGTLKLPKVKVSH